MRFLPELKCERAVRLGRPFSLCAHLHLDRMPFSLLNAPSNKVSVVYRCRGIWTCMSQSVAPTTCCNNVIGTVSATFALSDKMFCGALHKPRKLAETFMCGGRPVLPHQATAIIAKTLLSLKFGSPYRFQIFGHRWHSVDSIESRSASACAEKWPWAFRR